MKNTMKFKSLLSFFVPAAILSLSVASCSDYDNGYTESAIKFQEEFKKAYGDIDPEQDWNLAERGTVTVSTMKESEVKIYALRGNEYILVGDYEGVKDTKVLGFDMVEGTTSIMVTDGATAEKTVPGGVVTFGGTRTVRPNGTYDGVTITKLTSDVPINGETFPQYRTYTNDEVDGMLATVPQGENNIAKVISDFTYVSTGSFIIYPFYWYTGSQNTLGVYYTDENGKYHEVDIYESKGSRWEDWSDSNNTGELWYSMGETNVVTDDFESNPQDGSEGDAYAGGWTITKIDNTSNYCGFKVQGDHLDNQNDASGIVAPFMEIWRNNTQNVHIGTITLEKEFTVSKNVECIVEVSARLRNQIQNSIGNGQLIFSANDASVDITASGNNTQGVYNNQGLLYTDKNGTKKVFVKCTSDSNGKIKAKFELKGVDANWFAFKDLKITSYNKNLQTPSPDVINTPTGNSEFPGVNPIPYDLDRSDDVYAAFYKGQGIRVDIPKDTKFGMYIKKIDGSKDYTIYSEGTKNEKNPGLVGDKGDYSSHYASTFYVGDQMFIGFEDWPATTGGDYDLNDLVLAFSGAKPIIINEEADSWLMVCEDLGGSFDTDYNDVIFKVKHVSGKDKAKVTAMAAGGTLASYIVLNNGSNPQVVGEIHQMLGAAPEKSGEYTPINANSRYEAVGSVVTIDVPADFTMTYSTEVNSGAVNMGGFEIRTLNSGEGPAPVNATLNDLSNSQTSIIAAPGKGDAPYMLCLPYTYTKQEGNKLNTYVWAWPQELCTICSNTYKNGKYQGSNGGAYLDFGAWVSSYSDNRDWYKNPNPAGAMIVETLLLKSESLNEDMLQDPQLHPVNNPMVVNRGAIPDFVGNLESLSNGEYTIQVAGMSNTYNGESLWNAGDRQITVTQAAAGIYTGATTSFTLRILKDDSDLSVAANATMIKGKPFNLMSLITSTSSTGNITFKVRYGSQNWVVNCGEPYNADRPGQTVAYNASECGFTPTSTDNLTVEIYQAADNNFHESSVKTCAVTVSESGGGENTLSYTKQAMTLEADGNDYYTLGSSGHNYIISGSAFSSYSDAITINITGFTGNNLKAFIGSDDLTGFISKNQGDTWSISLTATQVNAVKSSNFTIKSSGDPTLVVKVQ